MTPPPYDGQGNVNGLDNVLAPCNALQLTQQRTTIRE